MKICNGCHIEKEESEFYTHLSKNKKKRLVNSECKICKYKREKALRQRQYDSRPVIIETHRVCKKCKLLQPIDEYRLKLSTGYKGQKIRYRSKSCNACERIRWNANQIDNIAPYYAKRLLSKSIKTEVTESMIEIKRVEIVVNRIKKVINKNNERT